MSAHAGIFYFDGRPVPPEAIRTLSDACRPYGPDRAGQLGPSPGVALIYRGLEVAPEDAFEQQPISMEGDCHLTWDGRLDNRGDLALELGLPVSHTLPDSRIAAAAYAQWGDDAYLRLIGDWSVALWDARRRTVTLTCDFMAIRSLYYIVANDYCAWSTCLEGLVELTGKHTDFDDDYLQAMVGPFSLPAKTPYRDIRVLSGAHTIRVDATGASAPRQYWHLPPNQIRYHDRRDYAVHLRSVFRDVVKSRLRTSHGVCMELSGGWDSSSVVCMAARIAAGGEFPSQSLSTLSYIMPGSPESDESRFMDAVTAHTEVPTTKIRIDDIPEPNFPASMHVRDVNPSRVSAHERMRDAGVRTLMTGKFGDGVMGNFPLDQTSIVWSLRLGRPIELIRQLRAWSLASERTAWQLLSLALADLLPVRVEVGANFKNFVKKWATDGGLSRRAPEIVLNERTLQLLHDANIRYARWCRQEEHAHVSRRFLRGLAHDMLTGRCTSPPETPYLMVTSPYRDRRLIEYICSIPWSTVCEPGRPRALMRDAFGPMLPDRISRRFSKGSFGPFQARRVVALAPLLTKRSTTPAVVDRGYVDAGVLAKYLDKCRSGAFAHSESIHGICVLEFWLVNALSKQTA